MPNDRLECRTLREAGAVEGAGRPPTVAGEEMGGEVEATAEGSILKTNCRSVEAKGPEI